MRAQETIVTTYTKDATLTALVSALAKADDESDDAMEALLAEARRESRKHKRARKEAWAALAAELKARKLLPADFSFDAYQMAYSEQNGQIKIRPRGCDAEEGSLGDALRQALGEAGINFDVRVEHRPGCPKANGKGAKAGKLLSMVKPESEEVH